MTSPYVAQEAKRLKLVHSAPPSKLGATRVGAHADHNPRDFHYARTQREAGIEHLEWEERVPVIRPWMFFAISAACWGILALALAWTLSAL